MSASREKTGTRAANIGGDAMELQVQGFGERFAWRMAGVFAGMGLLSASGALMQGSAMVFYAVLFCLPLTHWFRWRAMRDEQRRTEALEDERDAALLAARETGYRAQARHVFRELGYRWYHILPDAIVANPITFFHPRFLRSTFVPGKRS